jgi:CHASE2 domain-containing sensor protein
MNFLKKHPGLFLGLGIMILFLGLWFVRFQFVDTLELKYYDVMMKLRGAPDAESTIVMVDIDEDSIEKLGRWPWPRSLLSKGILKINQGKPKVIGLNLLLTEAEVSEGLREIESLEKMFEKDLLKGTGQEGQAFLQELQDIKVRLDNDKKLTDAFQSAGNVVLPMFFRESAVAVERTEEPDAALVAQSIQNIQNEGGFSVPIGNEIVLPITSFFAAAKGIGHFNLSYDMDGTARRERLLYEYDGLYFPSYTLRVASLFLNISMEDISADLGTGVYLGSQVEVPTTLYSEMLISFKGPRNSFRSFSYFDVINDKIPLSVFKNKLVLVSPSAAGIMNPLSTPRSHHARG